VTGGKPTTKRLKVPGGWLVCVESMVTQNITFYPDPKHTWRPRLVGDPPPIVAEEDAD